MRVSTLTRWCLVGICSVAAVSCLRKQESSQPIAFSHRLHVAKKIPCTFCHSGAEKYLAATLPSVSLCMGCHSVVKASSPEIQKVKQYLQKKEEIPWRRIYFLPREADVFFNHHRHAAVGIKCSTCHGNVGARDRLKQEVKLVMGFCIQCHREHRNDFRPVALADDCSTCHR